MGERLEDSVLDIKEIGNSFTRNPEHQQPKAIQQYSTKTTLILSEKQNKVLTHREIRITRIVGIVLSHQNVFHIHMVLTGPLIIIHRCVVGSAVFQNFDAHGPVGAHEVCQ